MPYTLKPELVERISPLVGQGLNGTQIAKAIGLGKREARWYAQQIRARRTSPNGAGPEQTPPAAECAMVPLEAIDLLTQCSADATQTRARMDTDTLDDYAEAMTEGATFPPVVLFPEGDLYWIGDGYHRIAAAQRVGFKTIKAEVRKGGRRAARLYAASANQTNGLRRTNADKRQAVLILLEDEEWQRWSDRQIARHCGVAHPFVAKLRQELSGNGYQMPETRQVRRGDTSYEMDTSRIGAHEVTTTPANGTSEPEDDRAIEPLPIMEPEADDDDAEDDAYTLYLEAWERLSGAHAFWVRHVDGRLVNEVVTRAQAGVSMHIKELRAMADSLQHYAAGLQYACEH
jgi:uncharacterized ParB-like nuclease family protein